jgi:hypothetical protein
MMPERYKFTANRKAALKSAQRKAWANKRSEAQKRSLAGARLSYTQMQRAKAIIKGKTKKLGF